MNTQIFVENNKLDLNKDLEASLTFSIDDIKEFASRNTSYSKTIVIPGTNQNNFVFGNIFDVNVFNDYDANLDNVGYNYNAAKSAQCLVYQDNIQVFKGIIRILEITIVKDVVEYECAVFGELGGFSTNVGDQLLSELDFSEYDHTFDIATIEASWTQPIGSGYYYPLIDYGYTTDGIDYPVLNFRPAFHAKEYIDKIFEAAGYTYESDFLDSDLFKKLIIPNNTDLVYVQVDQLFNRSRPLTSLPSAPQILPGGTPYVVTYTTDVGDQYASDTAGTITYGRATNITINALVEVRLAIENTGGVPFTTRVRLYKNSGILLDSQQETVPPGTFSSYNYSLDAFVTLATTDFLYVQVESDVGYDQIRILSASFSGVGDPVIKFDAAYGDDVTAASFVPADVKQIDFLTSIIQMFNLYITEDKDKDRHLVITPFPDFYDTDRTNVLNWTKKLDRSKVVKIKPLSEVNARVLEFKYKDDTDYYNTLYKDKYAYVYGTRRYDTSLEFVKAVDKVEVIFAATPMINVQGEDSRLVPAIFKNNAGTVERMKSKIRILWRTEANVTCDSWTISDGMVTLGTYTDYPYAGHWDNAESPAYDLLFGAPNEVYFTSDETYPSANLFNEYWSLYVAEITDKDSKLLTAYFLLDPVDILNLDFSKFVFISGQYYRLNKIEDYDTLYPDVTLCELLNVITII